MTDYKDLVTRLRETTSRSKRKLLDEAAETIEAMAADMAKAHDPDQCTICKHYGICPEEDMFCDDCGKCHCWTCKFGSNFEWRGVLK